MPFFIPIAIGVAVAGVAAAGAVGAAVKKRVDKKKRQRERAGQKPVEQGQHQEKQTHNQPAQSPRRQQSQTAERHQRPQSQPKEREHPSGRQPRDQTAQHQRPQSPKTPERQPNTQPLPRKFPTYDRQALVKALDTAIATAAEDTLEAAFLTPPFNHLSPCERTEKVRHNADAMRSALGGLRMPDYNDDITSAAYLLNYHPSHVGLAHAIVDHMMKSRGVGKLIAGDSGRLHVVDLASGTLAMQFGIAIAVADALVRGENIKGVVVDSVDDSLPAMLKVGRIAWDKFVLNVQSDENLIALAESCELIEPHRYVRQDAVPERDGECWLSCLNGVGISRNSGDLGHITRSTRQAAIPLLV